MSKMIKETRKGKRYRTDMKKNKIEKDAHRRMVIIVTSPDERT